MNHSTWLATAIIASSLLGCASQQSTIVANSLKDSFQEEFLIGTALTEEQILGYKPEDLQVVEAQFNAVTPENCMKWEEIHPSPGKYNFEVSDRLVNYAEQNNLFLIGHTLTWHAQTPEWVFINEDGNPKNKEQLLATLKDHIDTVAGRYKGRIPAWDVLNEALNDDGTFRESSWLKQAGPEYIEKAFQYAAEAAPDAKLYYNDYNLFKPEKRAAVVGIVKYLQAKGVRIDGVGIQGHYALDYPDLNQLEDTIRAFADLGVEVMITELDVSVLPFPEEENMGADVSISLDLQESMNPYRAGLPKRVDRKLAKRYSDLFELFLKYENSISRISLWGVNDAQTWRNYWPMKGRSDYPLLFNRDNTPKSAVQELIHLGNRD